MNKATRGRAAVFSAILVLNAALCAAQPPAGTEGNPPQEGLGQDVARAGKTNVIWILLDACRAQNLSCYGYDRKTSPNIDELAARGVLFEQHFSQAGFTMLSVPSYMTGRYFPVLCFSNADWKTMWRTPPAEEIFFSQVLAENGYRTCMVSAHPWMGQGTRIWNAFQDAFAVKASGDEVYPSLDELLRQALPWMLAHKESPFFLYIHALDTHWPHLFGGPFDWWVPDNPPNPDLRKRLPEDGIGSFSAQDAEFLRGLYDGGILRADTTIGILLDELAHADLLGKTVIIVASDHGEALAEDGGLAGHPSHLYADEVLHVPLIMVGPGLPAGRRVKQLTENADIFPTLVELLGLSSKARTDGKSMVPVIGTDTAATLHPYTFAKYTAYGMENFGVILRFGDVKYANNRFAPPYLKKQPEELWVTPDLLAHRADVAAEKPERLAEMRASLAVDIQPLWDQYDSLPPTTPAAFECLLPAPTQTGAFEPAEAVTGTDRFTRDGKWYLEPGSLMAVAGDNPPPVTLHLPVPNCLYAVRMLVASNRNEPASSFRYKCQGDSEFKEITEDSGNNTQVFVDLGDYEVSDNVFSVTLAQGKPSHWSIVMRFMFVPKTDQSAPAPSGQDLTEQREQLRALGYVR